MFWAKDINGWAYSQSLLYYILLILYFPTLNGNFILRIASDC